MLCTICKASSVDPVYYDEKGNEVTLEDLQGKVIRQSCGHYVRIDKAYTTGARASRLTKEQAERD